MIQGAQIIASYSNLNFNLAELPWPWKGSVPAAVPQRGQAAPNCSPMQGLLMWAKAGEHHPVTLEESTLRIGAGPGCAVSGTRLGGSAGWAAP